MLGSRVGVAGSGGFCGPGGGGGAGAGGGFGAGGFFLAQAPQPATQLAPVQKTSKNEQHLTKTRGKHEQ